MKLCYRVVVFWFFQRFSFRPFAKAAPRAAHFVFRYAPLGRLPVLYRRLVTLHPRLALAC